MSENPIIADLRAIMDAERKRRRERTTIDLPPPLLTFRCHVCGWSPPVPFLLSSCPACAEREADGTAEP